jgi:hypothetical protein
MTPHSIRIAACVLVATVALPMQGATQQLSTDTKTQHPLTCLPKGPGTTAAELSVSVAGITNPGATDETVLCPVLTDTELTWNSEDPTNATINVGYRPGAVAGRITCTAFVVAPNGSPIGSSTVVSTLQAANGGHAQINITLAGPAFEVFNTSKPVLSVACLLTPKVTLVRVQLVEKNQDTFVSGQ